MWLPAAQRTPKCVAPTRNTRIMPVRRKHPTHMQMHQFAKPSSEGPKVHARKRRCRRCGTILNAYHSGWYCYTHEPRLGMADNKGSWWKRADDLADLLDDAA